MKGVSRYIYTLILLLFVILVLPQVRSIFQEGGERWLYVLLLSFSLSFILTPLMRTVARRLGIFDMPDARKIHTDPVPLLGGVGIVISFLFSIYMNGIYSKELLGVILSSLVFFSSGLWDDLREGGLPSTVRVPMQILSFVVLVSFGVYAVILRPDPLGMAFNLSITFLWVIGVANAMNFFDGMDGLATGLSIIIASFLAIVAFQTDQPFLGWLSLAVLGSCLGFLPYNFRLRGGATIFLGDGGSNFLGFVLASLAIMGEWSESSLVASLVTPVLIFSILIYDMTYITISRIYRGKVKTIREWLEYTGRDHLHHRMEALLLSRRKSVLFIYLIAFTVSLNALVLREATATEAWLLLGQAIAIFVVLAILETAAARRNRRRG